MNLFKKIFFTLIAVMIISTAFAGLKKDSIVIIDNHYAVISEPSAIDVTYNDDVQSVSELYQNNDFAKIKIMMERGKDWFPMIERTFNEVGVPAELKYLAFIESGFNTRVYSRAGARGMWQFMRFTGARYGLTINRRMDERTNPEKATYAAALYFKKLFDQFNDWQLVAAAYNCGEGMLQTAIDKANGSTDFWEVYKFLPRETRKYVPHLLGIIDAMNSFTAQQELSAYLQNNGIVNASTPVVTTTYNNMALTSETTIIAPETLTASINATPIVKAEKEIYQKEFFVYIIKAGDSIESIARQFPKNSILTIKDNNNLSSNADLNTGSTLLLEK